MKVYVVSFVSSGRARYSGVYSVFDSLEKATIAIGNYCEYNNESIYSINYDKQKRAFVSHGVSLVQIKLLSTKNCPSFITTVWIFAFTSNESVFVYELPYPQKPAEE